MLIQFLQVLALSGRTGIPEAALRVEISIRYNRTVGDMEFAAAKSQALDRKLAVTREHDLTGDTVWTITEKGAKAVR